MTAIKPCPFGNNPGKQFFQQPDHETAYIICGSCGSSGPTDYKTKKDAVAAWNTRPAPKVKPLVWVTHGGIPGLHEASSPIGWYYNIWASEGVWYEGDPASGEPMRKKYATIEAAKAAAQADYDARILAALMMGDA